MISTLDLSHLRSIYCNNNSADDGDGDYDDDDDDQGLF